MNDIELAFTTITGKCPDIEMAFRYYDGDHPLVYATERLRQIFAGVSVRMVENWCAVVVDSVKDRMQLTGASVPDSAQAVIDEILQANEMDVESDDLHEAFLVAGEAFLIVWPDENNFPEMYCNDPRMCAAFYDSQHPRRVRFAAKLFVDDEGKYRMTLYYPDRLEYYLTEQKAENVTSVNSFSPDTSEYPGGVAKNQYGKIPVFHFRLRKRKVSGDLTDVIPLQNGINKLDTDMLVTAEYGAFKQRWIISNADTGKLKNAPNEIWNIPAGDGVGQGTQVGEFSSTDLGNYLNAVDNMAAKIAKITHTPKHYLFSQGGDPSGEALIAMESPLNRKVAARIKRVESVWRRALSFAAEIAGVTVDPKEISLKWQRVETVQPKTQAEIRLIDTQSGMPLRTVLSREGWSDAELDQMDADRETSGAAIGDTLLSAFDKGQ